MPEDVNRQPEERALAAVILAAGKGTRMNSELPKVMHEACGRPLVHWVVDATHAPGIECDPIVLVVGFGRELVEASFEPRPDWLRFAVQEEQLGTGHAIDMARGAFQDDATRACTDVLVLCGDGPLIRPETLAELRRRHVESGAAATLATAILDDATGYGRIQRAEDGSFDRIVEQKDATPEQLRIREVNPSYYIFRADALFDRLGRLGNDNANGEYYITEVFELMQQDGLRVEVLDAVPAEDVLSINTPEQLDEVESILGSRHNINHVKGSG
ncbi:MAG: NTP transferase domain-containing protein [Phycisphaerales bacterium]|nr:NTP transferase domain-containing protein [Phycisphaerales bacterium]